MQQAQPAAQRARMRQRRLAWAPASCPGASSAEWCPLLCSIREQAKFALREHEAFSTGQVRRRGGRSRGDPELSPPLVDAIAAGGGLACRRHRRRQFAGRVFDHTSRFGEGDAEQFFGCRAETKGIAGQPVRRLAPGGRRGLVAGCTVTVSKGWRLIRASHQRSTLWTAPSSCTVSRAFPANRSSSALRWNCATTNPVRIIRMTTVIGKTTPRIGRRRERLSRSERERGVRSTLPSLQRDAWRSGRARPYGEYAGERAADASVRNCRRQCDPSLGFRLIVRAPRRIGCRRAGGSALAGLDRQAHDDGHDVVPWIDGSRQPVDESSVTHGGAGRHRVGDSGSCGTVGGIVEPVEDAELDHIPRERLVRQAAVAPAIERPIAASKRRTLKAIGRVRPDPARAGVENTSF
jgi:hypothetical protein